MPRCRSSVSNSSTRSRSCGRWPRARRRPRSAAGCPWRRRRPWSDRPRSSARTPARRRRSPRTGSTRLTTFHRSSVAASYRSPVKTNSLARPTPARDARRWVPPIVGVSPMTRSTSPNFAFSDARMMSHARATSNAQVRVSAWAAKNVGNRQRVDAVGQLEHPVVQGLGVGRRLLGVELRDVDAAGDDLALGADQQCAGQISLDLVEGAVEVVMHLERVEVDRRRAERQHRDAAVVARR